MHSASTPNYQLPQFLGTDAPEWVEDLNPAFSTIDTQLKLANTNSTAADAAAQNALNIANTSATSAENAVNTANSSKTESGNALAIANEASVNATTASNDSREALDKVNGFDARITTNATNIETVTTTANEINTRLNGLTFVPLTQSEYDALETKDANTIYFVRADS